MALVNVVSGRDLGKKTEDRRPGHRRIPVARFPRMNFPRNVRPSGLSRSGGIALFAIACLGIGTFPLVWYDSGEYTAWAAGVQAVVVLFALGVALVTYLGDSRDRRVDRVFALHQELTTGEVGESRRRLGAFLRERGTPTNPVYSVSIQELRLDKASFQYANPNGRTPGADASVLLRFFERSRTAQATGSLDDRMFAALVGRHATWWELGKFPREALATKESAFAQEEGIEPSRRHSKCRYRASTVLLNGSGERTRTPVHDLQRVATEPSPCPGKRYAAAGR
jgi:hypothetical protein